MTLDFISIEDFIAAIATLADAIGEGFVALTLGFASVPTGIGFLVGAALVLLFRSVVPVSFEVESLTVVSRLTDRDWKKMAQVVLLAGIAGAVLGLLGAYTIIVDFIDGPILSGMMTGVGLILSFVAYETFKENKIIGGVSIVVALATFFLLIDDANNLIWALFASVAAAIVVSRFVPFKPIIDASSTVPEKIRLIPLERFTFLKDIKVIRAALALLALRVGTSIAYSGIDGQLSDTTPNVDHTNIIAGVAGAASALFGGAPVEPIISGTAAAPNPVTSGFIMMVVMGVLLVLGLLPKLAKWVPTASIAGFLFLLGAVLAIPGNIGGVITETDSFSGPVTVAVTAITFDPFLGMVCGILIRWFTGLVM
jgi:AGZA family xanthine/uracil permease-like MFS transporter